MGWPADLTLLVSKRITIADFVNTGYKLSRQLCPKKYQTLVISPRSYFVFTPLLASTAVGTLEFRTVLEPVRSRYKPNVEFIQGWADDVDFARKSVTIEENAVEYKKAAKSADLGYAEQRVGTDTANQGQGKRWTVNYDKLVVGVGCYSQTFGTKGVKEHAYFLKDISGARKIRKRILECFEFASLPIPREMKQQLLRFAIVGGGPTGMEFAAELHDLICEDLVRVYPELTSLVEISVYDVAPKVLSIFDQSLEEYATETFRREGIKIKTSHHVQALKFGLPNLRADMSGDIVQNSYGCHTLTIKEEGEVGVGLCVWSTGNSTNPFVLKQLGKSFPFPKSSAEITKHSSSPHRDGGSCDPPPPQSEWMIEKNPKTGTIVVDNHLRVKIHTKPSADPSNNKNDNGNSSATNPLTYAIIRDVFAIGDTASLASTTLPVTAQTANQQAIYLGKLLNSGTITDTTTKPFSFKNMGIMAYIGRQRGLLQTGSDSRGNIKGTAAWVIWRGAYMTMSASWRNKVLIPTIWYVSSPPSPPSPYSLLSLLSFFSPLFLKKNINLYVHLFSLLRQSNLSYVPKRRMGKKKERKKTQKKEMSEKR